MWRTSCPSSPTPSRQPLRGRAASGASRSEDNPHEPSNTCRGAKAHRQGSRVLSVRRQSLNICYMLLGTFRLHSGRGDRRVRRRTLPPPDAATVHTRSRSRDYSATLQDLIHTPKSSTPVPASLFQLFQASGHGKLCRARHALRRRSGPRQCGWFDCGRLIRSSVLYRRRCSLKGRLWEGNRRRYAQIEVYRP